MLTLFLHFMLFNQLSLQGIARQTDINEYVFIASITLIRDSNKVILVDTGLATDINGHTDLLTSRLFKKIIFKLKIP